MPGWNTKRGRALEDIGHEKRHKKLGKSKSAKIKARRKGKKRSSSPFR